MNTNVLEGEWMQIKGEIKSRWSKLTDADIERIGGDVDKLIGVLQEKYGYVTEEARRMVDQYLSEHGGLKGKTQELIGTVVSKDNLQRLATDTVELIRRYPLQFLLLGFSVGYLLARRAER